MNMKRIISVLTSAVLTHCCIAAGGTSFNGMLSDFIVSAADIESSGDLGENAAWELDTEGMLTIRGTGDMIWWADKPPWFGSFTWDLIKRVVISEGITNIGQYAFYGCEKLVSVEIPDTVTRVDKNAFTNCKSLTQVTLPDSVTEIGYEAFLNCSSLADLTLPSTISNIDDYAFKDSLWLEIKQKEDPLVIIGGFLYDGTTCSGDITIPDNVRVICNRAFADSQNLRSVIIPDSVTDIREYAFSGCPNLESVTIPESITAIKSGLFSGSNKLATITIPDSINSINGTAFLSTQWLEQKRKVDPVVVVNNIVVDGKTCSGDLIIPDGIKEISNSAFLGSEITSIVSPDSLTAIDQYAFAWSEKLEEVTIPNSVKELGALAFQDCTELKTITIPDSIEVINLQTFDGCDSLESVYLPESVNSIENHSFASCPSYAVITVMNPECDISMLFQTMPCIIKGYKGSTAEAYALKNGNKFIDIEHDEIEVVERGKCGPDLTYTLDNYGTLTISGKGRMGAYETDTEVLYWDPYGSPWRDKKGEIYKVVIEEGATNIFFTAFAAHSNLQMITIPDTVTQIDPLAFENSNRLRVIKGYKGSTAEEYAKKNNYSFVAIDDGSSLNKFGDPNSDGKVDANDASFILVEYSKLSTGGGSAMKTEQKEAADVNKDTKVDSKDASLILAYYSYLSTGGDSDIEGFIARNGRV
ncbi:Leucine rich repeat-containing protein [Ruminococcus sp. YRD2003]|uniref:leucine-rich repeat protein n=1 Tax=Ruminococcus sp. YRD2003 TaxID=1452313 RepID=UPI0008AE7E97|nr:Leucine rich repeat-containing protein [Ruminococcus flavefaciens]